MRLNTKNILFFGGWSGDLFLILLLLLSEIGAGAIGHDWGAFIYVTFHFVLIPFFSVVVLIITIVKVYRIPKQLQKIITCISISVPLGILYLTITGSPFLTDILKVSF